MRQASAASPLKVFGSQLAFYRSRAGLTSAEVGALVYLSGSTIRKVEAGLRAPTEDLVKACEDLPAALPEPAREPQKPRLPGVV